ncbi:MAG: class II aldolase/adducin family protein [Kiritimatiellae bacterium]|jgi:ribulose-5-phosphate 4-epimerase/fuculose-1-phosphate aldolase|nr:class II aldolase/adducin family protein [Kiritimatiellia bacterium]
MKDVPKDILNEFVETCHRAAHHGLMRCSSGNMSMRLDDTRMLATATRSWMENVTAEQVSVCRIADGALLEGAKPTVEIGFHAGILRTRADVNVVLHFQTPCATALACRKSEEINYFVIPEIPFYIGSIAHVPYISPGSNELADAVTEAMQEHDLVVMRNHGMVTVAADYAHVIQNAEFFEFACELITINKGEMQVLTVENVEGLKG